MMNALNEIGPQIKGQNKEKEQKKNKKQRTHFRTLPSFVTKSEKLRHLEEKAACMHELADT